MLEMLSELQAGAEVRSKNAAGRGRRQWNTKMLCNRGEIQGGKRNGRV